MTDAEKQVQQASLDAEKKILDELQKVYEQALKDCTATIEELATRSDLDNLQSIIYQQQYQEMLQQQLNNVLDNLQSNSYNSIEEYLTDCYTNGYTGAMYDIANQNIPVISPIRQDQVVKALQTNSKLSTSLYNALGENVTYLKNSIRAELSRGIANGSSWLDIAQHIATGMNSPWLSALARAMRIARTEGHRIQNEAALDAMQEAKDHGADIVKQWDATLDQRTRPAHQIADGQIRELDEPFDVGGEELDAPGIGGSAANVINCRCVVLQRAKWALSDEELKTLQDRADYFGLDKTDDFNTFKEKFLNITGNGDTMSTNIGNGYYPSTLGGAQRGAAMTFEEADSGNVNPHYGEAPGYSINCQSCVPTYEARLRGYDVEVLPNTKGSMLEKLSYDSAMAWVDPKTGTKPTYLYDDTATTPKKYLTFLQKTIEQGGRYSIEFSWKGRRRSGHIVNLDRDDSGNLRIKDNQRGLTEKSEYVGDTEVLSYLQRMKYTSSVYGMKYTCVPKVLRIDNMEFNESVVNQIMRKKQ